MRRLAWTWAVTALMAMAAVAQDRWEIKVYPVPRTSGPVTVDGELAEAGWRAAPLVSGFTLYDGSELADPQTDVRVIYDDEALYVGVRCQEPRMDLVAPAPVARDSREVFHGEAIEIFLDPGHSHRLYYQFGISAAGSIYDARVKDRVWSAATRAAVSREDSSWSAEVAIPWADVGVTPAPGSLLGFNVCRDRQVAHRQWTTWARVDADFHDPVRFAHLVLSPRPGAWEEMAAALRLGDRRGPIVIYTATGTRRTTYGDLAAAALAELRGALAELEVLAAAETSPVARQALTETVASSRRRLDTLTAQVAGPQPLDASAWSRMELILDRMTEDLGEALWAARLRALLSRI